MNCSADFKFSMSNRGMSGTASSRKRNRELADAAHRRQYPTCEFEATSLPQLKLHMEQHRRMSALTCPVCGFVAASRPALINHRDTAHSIPTTFECPYPDCPYSAGKDYELAGHLEEIHGKDFQEMRNLMCRMPGCGYVAANKADLRNHMKETHEVPKMVPKMLKCRKCGYETEDPEKFEQHLFGHVEEDISNYRGGRRGRTRKARRASRNLRRSSRRS